jgi:hypothetical protein
MVTGSGMARIAPYVLAVTSLFSWCLDARAEETNVGVSAPPTRDDDDAESAVIPPSPRPLRDFPDATPPVAVTTPGAEAPDVYALRRLAFEAHLGIATPVGSLGFVTEYAVHPVIGLGAGLGVGSGPRNGNKLHGALVARVRPMRRKGNALVFGAAYSFGGFERFGLHLGDGDPPPVADRADWAHWAQLDIGWERRAEKGFLIRITAGGAVLLNPADLVCTQSDAARCLSTSSQSLFTLDLALGFAGPV